MEPTDESASELRFNEGLGLFREQKYVDALPIFEDAVRLFQTNKDKSRAFALAGECYARLEKFGDARIYLDTSLKLDPENATALALRGDLYNNLEDVDAALSDYDAALDINPKSPKILTNKGIKLMSQGDLKGALVCFKKAAAFVPSSAEFVGNIGKTYLLMGDLEKALKYFVREVRIDKRAPQGWVHAGQCYHAKGDFRRALCALDRALKNDDKCFDAFNARGTVVRDLHQYSLAFVDYVAALQLSKNEKLVEKIAGVAKQSKLFKSCAADCHEASEGNISIDELISRLDNAVSVARQKYKL